MSNNIYEKSKIQYINFKAQSPNISLYLHIKFAIIKWFSWQKIIKKINEKLLINTEELNSDLKYQIIVDLSEEPEYSM